MEQIQSSTDNNGSEVVGSNLEKVQQNLLERASDWLKNKPELISIFEEFIKTPKQIDLTRKYEGKRDVKLVVDKSSTFSVGNQVISQKEISSDREIYFGKEVKNSNNEKPKIKKVTKKQKKKKNEKTTTSETTPSNSNSEIPHHEISMNNSNNSNNPIPNPTSEENNLINPIPKPTSEQNQNVEIQQEKTVKKKNSPSKSNKNKQDKKRKQKKDDRTLAHKKFKPMEPKEPPVKDFCKFFLHGNCHKGDSCPFSHDKKSFPCKFFHLYNSCKKGDSCEFSHQTPLSDAYRQLLVNTEKKFAQEPAKEDSNSNPLPFPQFENLQNSSSTLINTATNPTPHHTITTPSTPLFPTASLMVPFPTNSSTTLDENLTFTDPSPQPTLNSPQAIPNTISPALPFTNPFSNPFTHPKNY